MSRIGMQDSDGEGQSRNGTAIQNHSPYGFENFDVSNGQLRRRARRSQLQRNEDGIEKPETTKTFICLHQGCTRVFSSRFKLVRHLHIHSGDRPFQCNNCGRRFHRKDHLKNHLQVHNPNKIQHSCNFCQKSYCSLLSYRKHLALHAAESGDLECKLCGKALEDREGILHHLKVHTGSRTLRGPSERKYPCDRCDRSFFTKKDVKRHLVVHTGKRDFVCQYCPQRFGRKDHLVRHTKKSHVGTANSSPPGNEAMRKYEPPAHMPPPENHKNNNSMMGPPSMPDISGLVISPTTVSPLIEHTVLEPVKPDPTYGVPSSNLVQSNYGLTPLTAENGQHMGRFPDPALLPVSQYLPMSPSYPGVSPIMSHPYLNMSSSGNILSDLLPPMSMAPSFSASLSLDVSNPPLPHFSQAFQ
ncbi:zinc finger protein PLAGL2 [Parasteatoda tepidariorum]|uniref:zinc finger protein PLAGL2 n=1 Tax=Parasteatoda tepidariorum TaxID=114398 RepID=UPI00077FCA73|nr:zinc finger protein PLAGL2 [Parasteatoda tepidariorum]XP_015915024.1 zinc finger protein PLAGL2 [Parasteatoda tepidariorum]